jgi:hypothetical protein
VPHGVVSRFLGATSFKKKFKEKEKEKKKRKRQLGS